MLLGHGGSSSLGRQCVCFVRVCVCAHFAHRLVLQHVAGYRLRLDDIRSADGMSSAEKCEQASDIFYEWKQTWNAAIHHFYYLKRLKDGGTDGAKFICSKTATEVEKNATRLVLVGAKSRAVLVDRSDGEVSWCLAHDGESSDWIRTKNLLFLQIPENKSVDDCLFFRTESTDNTDDEEPLDFMLSTTLRLKDQEDETTLYLDGDGNNGEGQWVQLLPEESKAERELQITFTKVNVHTGLKSEKDEQETQHFFLKPCSEPSHDEPNETRGVRPSEKRDLL
eukprot:TRINITY_DN6203_c0_g1_i2.p1 TRINITY_DN6203_c0_g1~~TRINITY_DN6203_c0_g1_i2.p1  ORF type:complete len:280 (+),score=38.73 TRINITY_DN6203_c0_g1_i2:57-896(+)